MEFYKPLIRYADVVKKMTLAIQNAESNEAPVSDTLLFEVLADITSTRESPTESTDTKLDGSSGHIFVGIGWNKPEYQTSWVEFENSPIAPTPADLIPETYLTFLRTPYGVLAFEVDNSTTKEETTLLILNPSLKLTILKKLRYAYLKTLLNINSN